MKAYTDRQDSPAAVLHNLVKAASQEFGENSRDSRALVSLKQKAVTR